MLGLIVFNFQITEKYNNSIRRNVLIKKHFGLCQKLAGARLKILAIVFNNFDACGFILW